MRALVNVIIDKATKKSLLNEQMFRKQNNFCENPKHRSNAKKLSLKS